MIKKNLILAFILLFSINLFSQQSDPEKKSRKSRVNLGLGLNIPMKPNSVNYGLGFSVSQRYEYLLWEHFSLIQGLSYNTISGKDVREYYGNDYIQTQYETFSTLPLQIGMGYYFGEGQKTFFILLKGGWAAYWGVHPAYPAIVVNGNVVEEAKAREEFNGVYGFFTPSIGWQLNHLQISATYQGHIEQDASLNVLNISLAYRIF